MLVSTFIALAYALPGKFSGKDTNPLMKVSKSSNIFEAIGSSGSILKS